MVSEILSRMIAPQVFLSGFDWIFMIAARLASNLQCNDVWDSVEIMSKTTWVQLRQPRKQSSLSRIQRAAVIKRSIRP